MPSQRVTGHGIAMVIPDGRMARVWRELLQPPEVMGPIAHVANFAIPMAGPAFASDVIDLIAPGRIACMYAEYVPDHVIQPGVGRYRAQGFPAPFALSDFDPEVLRARRDGQAGLQRFFSVGNRPIALDAVIGTGPGAAAAVAALNRVLAALASIHRLMGLVRPVASLD